MQVRNVSQVCHYNCRFYAQNVSLIPLYNRIFVDSRSQTKPEGYDGDTCILDPDLPIYRRNWIEYNAKSIAHAFEIENWVRMNGGQAPMSWTEWMNLDEITREAIKMIANQVTSEINREVKQKEADLQQKLEASKEYKSPFAGAPTTPSFIK